MQAPFWTADFDAKQGTPGSGTYDRLETRDRGTRLAHVRWSISQFQKLLGDAPPQMDLSKDAYYELYTLAVSLVRAVALLERNQPHGRMSEVFLVRSNPLALMPSLGLSTDGLV